MTHLEKRKYWMIKTTYQKMCSHTINRLIVMRGFNAKSIMSLREKALNPMNIK